MSSSPQTPFDAIPRHLISREIAKRFAYLRRVVLTEMGRVLAPVGASVPLYHVLFRLATAEGPLSQQELTVDAGLDAAGVSRLVARMQRDKLVTIKVDAGDRRRRLIRLTPKGRALEESLSPLVDAAVRNMVTGLTEAEERTLLELLDRAVAGTMRLEQERRRRSRRRHRTSPDPPAPKQHPQRDQKARSG
jgi:DNA-binding MarR family transcriptional regulator